MGMSRDWLAADVNFLAWRAFYSTAARNPAAAVLGAAADARRTAARLECAGVVWCFDRKPYHRAKLLPDYKRRKKVNVHEADAAAEDELRAAIDRLRTDYLPRLGHANVFHSPGLEADDCLAGVARGLGPGDRVVLCSGDRDLYQLLGRHVAVWNAGAFYTARDFKTEHGIKPAQWVEVKALAGCESDRVPGVPGVAECTALKYVRGELPPHTKAHGWIEQFKRTPDYPRNLALVTVPWPDTPVYTPEPDPAPPDGAWAALCGDLGLPGFAAAEPPGRAWRREPVA